MTLIHNDTVLYYFFHVFTLSYRMIDIDHGGTNESGMGKTRT